jgi:Cys-rich four helix bundle protein (predicted Tat secretion target)
MGGPSEGLIMERREFLTAVSAVAAVATTSAAFAEEGKKAGGQAHHHPPLYKGVSEASAKCVDAGNNCLRHCFGMLNMGDSSMAACTQATYETIAACGALDSLAATNSTFTPAFAKVVANVCEACKKECDKFPDVAECVAMGAACKACAEECHKIAA